MEKRKCGRLGEISSLTLGGDHKLGLGIYNQRRSGGHLSRSRGCWDQLH